MSIILLEDYKEYNKITNPENDARLAYIIDYVNKFVPAYCGTSFSATPVTGVKTHSNDGSTILLDNAPLISVEQLKYKDTVIDSANYHVETKVGVIHSLTSFYLDRFVYSVDYTYGYPDVPEDVKLAGIEYVKYLDRREFNKSRSLGNGETAEYGDTARIPTHLRSVFNMYKVI